MAKLEAKVAELEEAINRVPAPVPAYFSGGMVEKEKKKPGPTKNIADHELWFNRDALVDWLEENWPKMVRPLLAANNPRKVAAILRQVAKLPDLRPPWQSRFVGHPAQLLDFLRSDRFRIRPPEKTVVDALSLSTSEKQRRAANRLPTRQIANAIAGVPKLEWRTSLDKCSQNPSTIKVAENTKKYYRAMFGIGNDKTD